MLLANVIKGSWMIASVTGLRYHVLEIKRWSGIDIQKSSLLRMINQRTFQEGGARMAV